MKTTVNLSSIIQWFKPLSEKKAPRNLTRTVTPRVAVLIMFALSFIAVGGWERLAAFAADVVPGGYVQIQPNAVTLMQGNTQQLRAAVLTPVGFELPNRKVTWSSNNPAIAMVSNTGLVTAVAPGVVTITAKSGAAQGTASVTVNGIVPPPPNTAPTVAINSPTDGAAFEQGELINFTATAADLEDGDLSAAVVWTVAPADDPDAAQTPLGMGAIVSAGTLAPGSYLVTARVTDSGNLVGITQIGITVNSPCSVFASLTPPSGLRVAQNLPLDASGSFDTCNRPLKYYWGCTSTTSLECPNFLAQANANDNTTSVVSLPLQESDEFDITLTVCAAGTNQCAPQLQRTFYGAPSSAFIQNGQENISSRASRGGNTAR